MDKYPSDRIMPPCEVSKAAVPHIDHYMVDINSRLVAGKRYLSGIPEGYLPELVKRLKKSGWEAKIVLSSIYVRALDEPRNYPFK